MKYMGDFADNSTIQIMFTTHAAAGGSVAPSSALESADVIIYKDNSATQKATVNGLTMTSPFDAIVGLHLLEIDTSVDTGDAGFWAVGSDYSVILSPDETVDSQTVVGALAQFSIENRSDSQTGDSFAIVNGASGSVATKTVVDAIPTTAMRGTDSAALASVATEARLAELDAANMPADIAAIPTTAMRGTDSAYTGTPPTAAAIADQVWDELQSAHVTVGSFGIIASEIAAIPTTAMRGTDSAALASVATEARLAELDAANLPADVDSILLDTAEIGTAGAGLTSIFTTAMTESYSVDGAAPTPAQSLFLIQQALTDVGIVSTTETIRKLDGSTAAATLTLDSASAPTSKTRAT